MLSNYIIHLPFNESSRCLTLCDNNVTASDILSKLNLPGNSCFRLALLNGKMLQENEVIEKNGSIDIFLHLRTTGLLGGKGGFGAMLRASAKRAGGKKTTNFGSCRDLSGRRLRHVNNEIALRRWKEEETLRQQARKTNLPLPESNTRSGVDRWYLGIPSWVEGYNDSQRQGGTLSASEIDENKKKVKKRKVKNFSEESKNNMKRLKIEKATSEYMKVDAGIATRMHEAVALGLQEQRKAKTDSNLKTSASSITRTHQTSTFTSSPTLSMITLSGNVLYNASSYIVAGANDAIFSTATFEYNIQTKKNSPLYFGSWYFEVTLVTNGLMQIGWVRDQEFKCDSENGDGVGDNKDSWAYDGFRQRRWNGEEEGHSYGSAAVEENICGKKNNDLDFSSSSTTSHSAFRTGDVRKSVEPWREGDVIGCMVEIEDNEAKISFSLNGKFLGNAFEKIKMNEKGLLPAVSLEAGESLYINIGQCQWKHNPPTGYKPLYQSVLTKQKRVERKNNWKETNLEKKKPKKNEVVPLDIVRIDITKVLSSEKLASQLGLEGLRNQLIVRGMKCGGSLMQRAERLFRVRYISDDSKIPKDLLKGNAKSKKRRRKNTSQEEKLLK
eukprot:g5063.t1